MFRILDVSRHQPIIDYQKVSSQIDGVLLRLGVTYWGAYKMSIDECFQKHYEGFKNCGVPIGVYYYSCADTIDRAKAEADFVLNLLKDLKLELPVYFDVENPERQGSLSSELLSEIVDTFCSKIESHNYFTGIYSSTSWLKRINKAVRNKYTIWKADYRRFYDRTIKCDIHQYTSNAFIKGINRNVDMSNCYVDFPKIIKENGLNNFESINKISTIHCKGSEGDINTIKQFCIDFGLEWSVSDD